MPLFKPNSSKKTGRSPESSSTHITMPIADSHTKFVDLRNRADPGNIDCTRCGDKTIISCAEHQIQEGTPGCPKLRRRQNQAQRRRH